MASRTESRWRRAIGEEEEQTRGTTQDIREFDPQQAAERSARAQFETFREDLGSDIQDLRGQQVGMGRLDTGFAGRDEGEFISDRLDRLDRALATNALTVSGQNLDRHRLLAGLRGRYFDMLSGQLDREQAARNAKLGFLGTLATAGGTIAGAAVAGPPGAAAGGAAGRAAAGGGGGGH
ncbi:MAG: hypothetical protein ACOC42_01830 [Halobacteriota archaeon]